MVLGESSEHRDDVVRLLIAESQQNHASVTTRRISARIAEAEVEGDQRTLVADRRSEHLGIGPAREVLLGNRVDVVAEREERILGDDGDISSSLSFTCWA
jgi:hypothetical protein